MVYNKINFISKLNANSNFYLPRLRFTLSFITKSLISSLKFLSKTIYLPICSVSENVRKRSDKTQFELFNIHTQSAIIIIQLLNFRNILIFPLSLFQTQYFRNPH